MSAAGRDRARAAAVKERRAPVRERAFSSRDRESNSVPAHYECAALPDELSRLGQNERTIAEAGHNNQGKVLY